MNLLSSVFGVVIAMLMVCVLVLGIVWLVTDYYHEFIKTEPPIQSPSWKLDMSTIQLTTELGKYIDQLIEFETFSELLEVKALNTQYDVRKLDIGVKNISNRVYQVLNPDIFKTQYLIKSDSIMTYIVTHTKTFFVSSVVDHNNRMGG